MAPPLKAPPPDPVAYQGEVWTDARGLATVRLPAGANPLEPPLEYELRDLDPQSRTRVTGELKNGRFTIQTDEPHVKVAWRIRGRRVPVRPRLATRGTGIEGDDRLGTRLQRRRR